MGNTSSNVTDGVKSQAEASSSRPVYKLVNLAGGGELIDMMKTAIRRRNFDEIDQKILSEVRNVLSVLNRLFNSCCFRCRNVSMRRGLARLFH